MVLAQPEHVYQLLAEPNDPLYPAGVRSSGQWHLPQVSAPQAWDVGTGSKGVGVCLIDSGARRFHVDLTANIAGVWDRWGTPKLGVAGRQQTAGARGGSGGVCARGAARCRRAAHRACCAPPACRSVNVETGLQPAPDTPAYSNITDETGHGTAVAGIIGAMGNNGVGVTGVAWATALWVCRAESGDGVVYERAVLDCLALCQAQVQRGPRLRCAHAGRRRAAGRMQQVLPGRWRRSLPPCKPPPPTSLPNWFPSPTAGGEGGFRQLRRLRVLAGPGGRGGRPVRGGQAAGGGRRQRRPECHHAPNVPRLVPAALRGVRYKGRAAARVRQGGGSKRCSGRRCRAACKQRGVPRRAATRPPNRPPNRVLCFPCAVGASAADDALARFSNWSPTFVHLAAPGVNILTTYNSGDGDYWRLSGTSFAAPQVAGAAALMWAARPDASPANIK